MKDSFKYCQPIREQAFILFQRVFATDAETSAPALLQPLARLGGKLPDSGQESRLLLQDQLDGEDAVGMEEVEEDAEGGQEGGGGEEERGGAGV